MNTNRDYVVSAMSMMTICTALIGCGQPDDETITSELVGEVPVAFQRSDNSLEVATGPNAGSNSFIPMSAGTVPSQVTLPSGSLQIGFRKNSGHFLVDTFTLPNAHSSIDSGGVTAGGTSPSLALCSVCGSSWAFAFQGANGHFWVGQGGSPFNGVDTGGAMQGGTSPSIAMFTNGVLAIAFHGSNGNLWAGLNGPNSGQDTHGLMASGSSPSIAVGPGNQVGVAFRGGNGNLWFGPGPFNGSDTFLPMKAGTSPSVAIQTNGTAVVAFQHSNGFLFTFSPPNSSTNTNQFMGNSASPAIQAVAAGGSQILFKGSNGHLWIRLNGTSEDQGFAMN